ncbi:MAG: hypothetical protein OEZ47_13395, partial [Gammaproteobacteria bacterium]|nr:hypothetical protein [Gammaproteobacteria bacterium]
NLLLAGDTLLGNALVVTGTHTLDPQGTFTLTVRVTEDIRFEPVGGFIVDSAVGANVQLVYNVTDWLENPDSLGTPVDLTTCITTNTLMDAVTKHIALNEGTQCGQSKSIGNIIKDNMKNKYDVSNS